MSDAEPSTTAHSAVLDSPKPARDARDRALLPLDDSECWSLLQSVDIGRIAWADVTGLVVVLPVNFAVDDATIVFRSAPGEKLAAVAAGAPMSFEADDAEPALRVGWSVLASGPVEEVVDAQEAQRLQELVRPWFPGARTHVLRMRPAQLSGRRSPAHPGSVTHVWLGP